jgi:hypothetical protein
MGNPMQVQTDAMTPAELLKCYYRLDTKRQTELLAYVVELREERRDELRTRRRTAKRAPAGQATISTVCAVASTDPATHSSTRPRRTRAGPDVEGA